MRTGICFTLLLLSLYSVAQEPEFSRLGVNEGLSQNSVYGLLQDKQGFLWIGTGDGLNRYDGKNFVQYRGSYNDTSGAGLSARIITGRIAEDSKERLWFGSNNGLILFDKRTQIFTDPVNFNPSLKKFNTGIRVIGIDRNDHVWLHNDKNDLFVLDPSKWSLRVMIAATSKGEVNNAGELSGDHFYYLRKDGLYSFNINGQQHRKILQIQSPSLLKKTMAGKVIVHTRKSFIVYDPRNNSAKKYTIPGNLKRMLSVMQEWPEGIFYLNASPEGIARFDIHKNELVFLRNQPADPSSLSSDLVLDGYLDKTLNLWIATEGGGLNRLDLKPSRFQNFPSYAFNRNEAANLMVKSIFRCGNKARTLFNNAFNSSGWCA